MDYKTNCFEKELNNNSLTIHSKKVVIPTHEILSYLDPLKFNAYCKNGCPNYSQKWTCPPNCPPFEVYAKDFSHISLYLFYTSPHQLKDVDEENKALHAYEFIKEELQAFLRKIEPADGKMVAANSCELCKTCGIVLGKDCYIPERIRYNLVAFGFNVSKIMTDLFQHELKWAGKNHVPEFVSSIGAILS